MLPTRKENKPLRKSGTSTITVKPDPPTIPTALHLAIPPRQCRHRPQLAKQARRPALDQELRGVHGDVEEQLLGSELQEEDETVGSQGDLGNIAHT